MISRALKILIVLTVASVLSGCKLAVIVPPGGQVQSTSNTRNCDGGTDGKFCTFDLSAVSLPFKEKFTASAKPGYQFVRWQGGNGFLCGDSTKPTCTVKIADDELGPGILAAYEISNIMPVFKDVGVDTDGDGIFDREDDDDDNDGILDDQDNCPLVGPNNDGYGCAAAVVIVNGRQWVKSDLGSTLTWNEINAVCPAGICNGLIEGSDMTGWHWATTGEVHSLLFAHYFNTAAQSECYNFFADFGSHDVYVNLTAVKARGGLVSDDNTSAPIVSLSVDLPSGSTLCGQFDVPFGALPISVGGWFYHN